MALHCFSTIWHCFSNSMATCIQWVLPFHHFWGCYAWLDADRAQYISPSADWRAFLFSLPNFRWKIGTWPHNHHDHGDLRVSPVLRSLRTTITITIISYQELTTTKSWTNSIISLNKQSTHASSPSELKAKSFLHLFCGLETFMVRVCQASVDVEHAELCTEYYRDTLSLVSQAPFLSRSPYIIVKDFHIWHPTLKNSADDSILHLTRFSCQIFIAFISLRVGDEIGLRNEDPDEEWVI